MDSGWRFDDLIAPLDRQIEIQAGIYRNEMLEIITKYRPKDIILSNNARTEIDEFAKKLSHTIIKSLSPTYTDELRKFYNDDGIASYIYYKVRNIILDELGMLMTRQDIY